MKNLFFLFPFITFVFVSSLFGQVTEPVDPISPVINEPSVQFDASALASKGIPFRCCVVVVGERTNIGTVFFPTAEMTFYFEKNGKPYQNTFPMTNLESIEFLKWKGYRQKDGSFIFYPLSTRVSLKDGSTITCTYYLESLGKLEYRNLTGSTALYAYFYEYRSGGLWQNSKKRELQYPETHPPHGCLKKLIFQ